MCPVLYLHCYKVDPLVQEVVQNPCWKHSQIVMLTENYSQKSQNIPGIYVSTNLGEFLTFSRMVRDLT